MVVQSYSKQLNTKTDKLSSQVNTNFDILEEASRKARNLEESETWQDTERKLRDFLHYYLNITNIHIERAHLVSRKEKAGSETSNNKPRTEIPKLLCYKDKEGILRRAATLKNTNVYVPGLMFMGFFHVKFS